MQKTQDRISHFPKGMLLAYGLLYLILGLADLGSPLVYQSLSAYLAVTLFLSAYFAILVCFGWENVAGVLLWLGLGNVGIALTQLGMGNSRPQGLFGSSNYLGTYCALALFLALRVRSRFFAAVAVVGLLISQSRTAVAAALVGMFFVAPPKYRKYWLALPICGVALYWLRNPTSLQTRIGLYEFVIRGLMDRPILGWGQAKLWGNPLLGQYNVYLGGVYNIYLDWASTAGLVGLVAFLCAAAITFRRSQGPWRGLCAAYLANGLLLHDTVGASAIVLLMLYAIASEHRHEVLHLVVVQNDEPFADRGAGALRAD